MIWHIGTCSDGLTGSHCQSALGSDALYSRFTPRGGGKVRGEYREKDRINPLTSAILPSYAPINQQPVRLNVTYDVIGNPHYPYVIVDLGLQLALQLED